MRFRISSWNIRPHQRGDGGCRNWDSQLEAEADWQGALLVLRDGALEWLRNGGKLKDGADNFGVSLELFRWRVNHTGIAKQLGTMRLNIIEGKL